MPGPMGEPFLEGATVEGAMSDVAVEALVVEGAEGENALGQPSAPQEPGHEPDHDSKPPWPSNRALTITIVLATLVAAVAGFLLNRASASSSNASDTAQELNLRGSAQSTAAYQQAETDYAQYIDLQAAQAKAAEEMVEAGYNQPGAANWADLFNVANAQARSISSGLPKDLRPDLPDGNPDPSFPLDFFDRRAWQGTFLEAESDAYNYVSGQWNKVVDSYTAILTMLAVSLFLFGSAYVLYGRNRLLFSAVGAGLVLVGLIWGGSLVTVNVPNQVSDVAARDYANGVVALSEASTPADYRPALRDFTAAIKARPDYADAYAQRASAEEGIGSQELGYGFVSNISPHWARLAEADDLEAYNLGDHEVEQVSNVGWDLYSLWLMDGTKGAPPAQALQFNALGAKLDPSNPVNWMNLGVDNLAAGNYSNAMNDYTAAATHILYTCREPSDLSTCKEYQPQQASGEQSDWLAGGMQDLEGLAASPMGRSSAALRSEITKAKGVLTASLAYNRVANAKPLPFKKPYMSGFLDPNIIQLDVAVPTGMAHTKFLDSPLTLIWYQRANDKGNWNGISETTCWGTGSETCTEWKQKGNYLQFRTEFLQADGECFTNVQYKAELYDAGTLVGSLVLSPKATSTSDYLTTNLSAAEAPGMNFGICVPATWRQRPLQKMTVTVSGTNKKISGTLANGELQYASADGKSGVFLLRIYTLHQNYTTNKQLQALVTDVNEYALSLFEGHGMPSGFTSSGSYTPQSLWGDALTDMMTNVYSSGPTYAAVAGALVASGGADYGAQYQDESIAQNVAYGDYDDAVVVAIVYGPSSMWATQHALGIQVLSSASLLGYG